MAQLSKGDTFADGQQLTATRLNQLVDSGQILAGAITEQTAITAGTLEATDATIVSDAGVLKKATIGDVLGSNVPVVTSAITAGANKDVVFTPNDGVIFNGASYTSGDGLTVTVTSAAHGLVVGQIVLIAGAGTGYNGTFRVATVATNSFTYVMTTAATAGSATLSYTKKGAVRNAGNESITGNLFVAGAIESPTIKSTTAAEFNLSTAKTSNVTTAMQFSGVPVMGLATIIETSVPFFQCDGTTAGGVSSTCNQWKTVLTLSGLTKTDKEMWVIEAEFPAVYYSIVSAKFRLVQASTSTVLAMQQTFVQGLSNYQTLQVYIKGVIPLGTTFTADSIRLECFYGITSVNAAAILNVGFGGALSDSTITRVARVTKYNKP